MDKKRIEIMIDPRSQGPSLCCDGTWRQLQPAIPQETSCRQGECGQLARAGSLCSRVLSLFEALFWPEGVIYIPVGHDLAICEWHAIDACCAIPRSPRAGVLCVDRGECARRHRCAVFHAGAPGRRAAAEGYPARNFLRVKKLYQVTQNVAMTFMAW